MLSAKAPEGAASTRNAIAGAPNPLRRHRNSIIHRRPETVRGLKGHQSAALFDAKEGQRRPSQIPPIQALSLSFDGPGGAATFEPRLTPRSYESIVRQTPPDCNPPVDGARF